MKNHQSIALGLCGGLLALSVAAIAPAPASAPQGNGASFEVTVTNLTRGQVLSPPLVATHSADAALFVLGQPASPELATLAEDGDAAPLASLLGGLAAVGDVQAGMDPIPPGASASITVEARGNARLVSLATMLVNTNDAFAAIDGMALPTGREARTFAVAYDAGSEFNSESCSTIPGPACAGAGAGVRDTVGAEGYVFVSNGIQGVGELAAAEYDWRNPVAEVTIRRVNRR